MKNMRLHNIDILEKCLKDQTFNKIYIAEKDDFEILRRPYVTFNEISGHTLFNKKNCVLIMLTIIEILQSSSPGVFQ